MTPLPRIDEINILVDASIPLRRCTRCKNWYPATLASFRARTRKSKTGLQAWCKVCQRWFEQRYHAQKREAVC